MIVPSWVGGGIGPCPGLAVLVCSALIYTVGSLRGQPPSRIHKGRHNPWLFSDLQGGGKPRTPRHKSYQLAPHGSLVDFVTRSPDGSSRSNLRAALVGDNE
ncbi:hypothetical protein GGR50DRAFT_624935 [Xylaria sp. CBS 124048]|nr:hypothetical protein GGR50DRAFT_624935 [Xylaria sp. CBS 124048]